MREIKELKFEELTVEQKIGMVTCCLFAGSERTKESDEFVYDLIKKRAVGCVWINPDTEDFEGTMKKIKDLADYPLLVIADAEKGIHEYKIGRHNAIGMTGSEELDAKFVAEATKAGLVSLKGHRVTGGMRASIYNAMPIEGVKALIEFMKKFELENK